MKTLAAAYTSDDSFVAGLLVAFALTGVAVTLVCYRASQLILAMLLSAS